MRRVHRPVLGGLLVAGLLAGCAAPAPEPAGPDVRREGSLVFDGIPEVPAAVEARVGRYLSTRSASLQGWLPDGSILIATRFGETRQIHRVTEPGGARHQLTFLDEPVASAEPSPDPDRPGFLHLRDEGGAENYQVYFQDLATGHSTRLSDGVSRNLAPVFDRDGDRVAFASTARNGRDTDVRLGDLSGGDSRLLTQRPGTWYPVEFSTDGERLLVQQYVSRSESRPWVVALDSGTMTRVLDPGLQVRVDDVAFGPDGGFLLSSDLGGDFVRLYRLAAAGTEPVAITGDVAWDLEQFALSDDGRWLAFSINEEARSRLRVRDLQRSRFVALPEIPEGVLRGLAFGPESDRLAFTLSSATRPGDVHVIDLERRTRSRWTRSETGGLDRAGFVEPEHFRFPTFDTPGGEVAGPRRQIPAFILRPEGPRVRPHPVIISIHGGPESQARPGFSPTLQYRVAELGAAVIRPNVRGSTGYGRSFHRLDDGRRREDAVRDIGALLDWIETQPDLDPDRVVVTGGSYGGYMVLAALARYPDRIAAGVETVGISSFVTFLENTEAYRRDLRRAEYGDERDPEMRAFLEKISPLNRIERMRAPLLVIQGANDPRVPAGESEQIVAALRDRGLPVWYLLALDEGHGFRKQGNRRAAAAVIGWFLERQLHGAPAD